MKLAIELICGAATLYGIWKYWLTPNGFGSFKKKQQDYIDMMNDKRNDSRPD
jgi:hypothetical protein